jgi:hypothetical protein
MIIFLGLPKSGTTSFQYLFEFLGYNSYHWTKGEEYIGMIIYKNKISNKKLLNGFLENDVITQMDVCMDNKNEYWPQITDFMQLYYENPESIFILNKREPTELLDSFKRWNGLNQRLVKYNPEILDDYSDNAFINFVKNYYQEVEMFFKKHPNSKFIIYDINNDNIEKLKKYIDIKDIKMLPHYNKNNK